MWPKNISIAALVLTSTPDHLGFKLQKYDLHHQERAIKNFASADAEFGRKIRELIDTKYSSKPATTSGAVQVKVHDNSDHGIDDDDDDDDDILKI